MHAYYKKLSYVSCIVPPLFTSPSRYPADDEDSNSCFGKSNNSLSGSGFNIAKSRPKTADNSYATSNSSISTRYLLGSPSNTGVGSNDSSCLSSMNSEVYSPSRMRHHSSAVLSPIPGARPLTSPHLNPLSTISILNATTVRSKLDSKIDEIQNNSMSTFDSVDDKIGRDIIIPADGKRLSGMSSLTQLSMRNSNASNLLQSTESLSKENQGLVFPEIKGIRCQNQNMNALRIALMKPIKLNKLLPLQSTAVV